MDPGDRALAENWLSSLPVPSFRVILALILVFVVHRIIETRKVIRSFNSLPGYRTLVPAHSVLGALLPPVRGLTVGHSHFYDNKWKVFEQAGWDAIVNISLFSSIASLEIADASAMKQIFASRSQFPKPLELPVYEQLGSFGKNIVASEGEEWKRFRKIAGPAFSERNNRLVWNETVKIVTSLFEDVWGHTQAGNGKGGDVIVLDHAPDLTLELSLLIIGSAGFGRTISWSQEQNTFKSTLNIVSENLMLKLFLNQVPSWIPEGWVNWGVDAVRGSSSKGGLGHKAATKEVRKAFRDFDVFMQEMIEERRTSGVGREERHDLFNNLLDANEAYDEALEKSTSRGDNGTGSVDRIGDDNFEMVAGKLTDEELIGNVFMFLLAGHETTAYTLTWAMAMLALYPKEQDTLYKHIKSVIPDGKTPTYEDMPSLTRVLAVIHETLRMFPTGSVRKTCEEDTAVTVGNINGQTTTVPIPKGTEIVMNSTGMQYNPRYWKDPETFNPDRFLGDYHRDAYIPFSAGARSCIGRRFSETESVAFITLLVSNYTIEIKDEPEFRGESFEERKQRILRGFQAISLVPYRIPLVLKRRVF